jgi:hypothetical protein
MGHDPAGPRETTSSRNQQCESVDHLRPATGRCLGRPPTCPYTSLGHWSRGRGECRISQDDLHIDRKFGNQNQENMWPVTGTTTRRTQQALLADLALASTFDLALQRGGSSGGRSALQSRCLRYGMCRQWEPWIIKLQYLHGLDRAERVARRRAQREGPPCLLAGPLTACLRAPTTCPTQHPGSENHSVMGISF